MWLRGSAITPARSTHPGDHEIFLDLYALTITNGVATAVLTVKSTLFHKSLLQLKLISL